MREIKFRVWDKENKQWAGPGQHLLGYVVAWKNPIEFEIEREGFEFVQYTGLKDKNGKEIYESDVVEFNDFASLRTGGHIDDNIVVGKVQFLYGGWMVDSKEGHYDLYEAVINDEEIEVIGNIYENPELLEGASQ